MSIIKIGPHTAIVNGGDPLPGCPSNSDEANKWAEAVNGDKEKWDHPLWSWDCGFKLDYDGPIVSVSSRFYPPKTHYGPTWDGNVTIKVFGNEVARKSFDCQTLEGLRAEVEAWVKSFGAGIAATIKRAPSQAGEGSP